MEDLTYEAKIAVLRILYDIVNADSVVHEKEVEYMNEMARFLALGEDYLEAVANVVTLQALTVVRKLAPEVKEQIAGSMGKMIVIDRDINYNEVKLYNTLCELCNIEKDFNIKDYPDYTLSGPFVNPEDMFDAK